MAAVVPSVGKQTATFIFLHGVGDTGHNSCNKLSSYVPKYCKLMCPHASKRPLTMTGGSMKPAWWDIRSWDQVDENEDEEGIKKCSKDIQEMIQKEVNDGIPANRIVLGGFSQGAAASLYTGLTGRFTLGGLVVLTGYLPIRNSIKWDEVNKPPTLQYHDTDGLTVPYKIGQMTKEKLKAHLPNFTFKYYSELGNSLGVEEMDEVKKFLKKVLPPL